MADQIVKNPIGLFGTCPSGNKSHNHIECVCPSCIHLGHKVYRCVISDVWYRGHELENIVQMDNVHL